MDIIFGKTTGPIIQKEVELDQFYFKQKNTGEKYGDRYGHSVKINDSANVIIVGDPGYRIPNSSPSWTLGKIDIFTGNYISGWAIKQTVLGFGEYILNQNYRFGSSIATNYDASIIINGGPGYSQSSGGAMILTGSLEGGWIHKQFITGFSTFSNFGIAVATNNNGSVIAMSTPNYNVNENTNAGGTMIFTGNSIDGWKFKQIFTGNKPYQNFGSSITMDSGANTIVIGSEWNGVSRSGCVSIFTGDSQAGWNLKQEIYGDSSFDYFGTSVATNNNGDVIAIGAPGDEISHVDAGSVNIYTGNQLNGWQLKQKIFGNFFYDGLGSSIAINNSGTIIAVGESYDNPNGISDAGSAMILTGNAQFGWAIKQTITGNSENGRFGYSLSMDKNGNTVIMGGPGDNTIPNSGGGVTSVGAVIIYTNKLIEESELLSGDISFISDGHDSKINFF